MKGAVNDRKTKIILGFLSCGPRTPDIVPRFEARTRRRNLGCSSSGVRRFVFRRAVLLLQAPSRALAHQPRAKAILRPPTCPPRPARPPGETCTTPEGPFAGVDDCALGSVCWDVDADNHGIFFRQCTGTSNAPLCPLKTSCRSDQYLVLALCLPNCDPILRPLAASGLSVDGAIDHTAQIGRRPARMVSSQLAWTPAS